MTNLFARCSCFVLLEITNDFKCFISKQMLMVCSQSASAFPAEINFSFLDKRFPDPDEFRGGFGDSYVTH